MRPETPPGCPFRCATRGDSRTTRLVPWIVVVPLLFVIGVILSGPPSLARWMGATGTALAALVACLPALAGLSSANRAWVKRTMTVADDALIVDMPGRDAQRFPCAVVERVATVPFTAGIQIPPASQLITEFHGRDGRRIAELSVHHYTYRYAFRTTESNPDGPPLLAALAGSACGPVLDIATRALIEIASGTPDEVADDLSPVTVSAMRSMHFHAALRGASRDSKRNGRVSHTLIRLDCLLARNAMETARDALEENPADPMVRYYLAHICLRAVGASVDARPLVLQHRAELRAEARDLLEGLLSVPEYAEAARGDLEGMEPKPQATGRVFGIEPPSTVRGAPRLRNDAPSAVAKIGQRLRGGRRG